MNLTKNNNPFFDAEPMFSSLSHDESIVFLPEVELYPLLPSPSHERVWIMLRQANIPFLYHEKMDALSSLGTEVSIDFTIYTADSTLHLCLIEELPFPKRITTSEDGDWADVPAETVTDDKENPIHYLYMSTNKDMFHQQIVSLLITIDPSAVILSRYEAESHRKKPHTV